MSQRKQRMDRKGENMVLEAVLTHDVQIAVLLDMLANRVYLDPEDGEKKPIIDPEKYKRNIVKLAEFRNREYGGKEKADAVSKG